MNESRQLLKGLIWGVAHLCVRTRELAQSGSREPMALLPLRESLDVLLRTMDELELAWELEPEQARPLPLPERRGERVPEARTGR